MDLDKDLDEKKMELVKELDDDDDEEKKERR